MLVLGNIGQLRKIAERAHDRDRANGIEFVKHGLQLALGLRIAVPAKSDCVLARALNQVVYCLALLFAQGIAENTSQQANIFPQRRFLVGWSRIQVWSIHVSKGLPLVRRARLVAQRQPDAATARVLLSKRCARPRQIFFTLNSRRCILLSAAAAEVHAQ